LISSPSKFGPFYDTEPDHDNTQPRTSFLITFEST
jgi:hypothetical protein